MNHKIKGKISTLFMLVILFAQTLTPVVTVFAEDTTSGTQASSEVQSVNETLSSEKIQAEGVSTTSASSSTSMPASENKTAPTSSSTEVSTSTEPSTSASNEAAPVSPEETSATEESTEEDEEPAQSNTGEKRKEKQDTPTVIQDGTNLEGVFTFERFVVGTIDSEGKRTIEKEYDLNQTEPIPVKQDTTYWIDFNWSVFGKSAKAGDTADVQLPNAFNEINISSPQPIIADGGIEVGTFVVQNSKMIFTFNENITTVEGGKAEVGLVFSETKFQENVRQEIEINGENGGDIPIFMVPSNEVKTIEKKGTPDKQENAKSITWEIDVVNTGETILNNTEVTDDISNVEGLGAAIDFKIYKIDIKLDGSKVVSKDPIAKDVTGFPINFDPMDPYTGYQIVYTTPIVDKTKTSFTNTANFNGKSNSAIVSGLTRSKTIDKSNGTFIQGAEGKKDRIKWTIEVNKNGTILENAIVSDVLPEGLTILNETIKVLKNTTDVTETDKQKFPLEIGKVTENDIFTITYETEVDYSKVNDGKYLKVNTFTNTATLKDGPTEIVDTDTGEVTYNRTDILKKAGKPTVNYQTKEILWTINVNEALHPFKGDIVITDTIPSGLGIAENNIIITDSKGNEIPGATKHVDSNQGVTVTFPAGTLDLKSAKITYTTPITDLTKDSFTNIAEIDGTGIGPVGDITKEEITVKPAESTFVKTSGAIDYAKRTIDWAITFSPIRNGVQAGLEITDSFGPNYGLILIEIEDGFTVKLGGTTLEKGTHYELTPVNSGIDAGFIVKMKVAINDTLTINYKTSFDTDLVQEHYVGPKDTYKYTNTASIKGTQDTGTLCRTKGYI